MMTYRGKTEYQFLASQMAKVEKIYKREKSELLKRMAAADLDWAWGLPRRRQTETG